MCNNYLDDQIISKIYQTNLVKKNLDIEVINQFIIQPHIPEKEEKINEITEISKEHEEKITKEIKIKLKRLLCWVLCNKLCFMCMRSGMAMEIRFHQE